MKFTSLKWLKMHLNYPQWLEIFLKFATLKWLKMHSNCPPWLENILKFTALKWLKTCIQIVHHGWRKFWNLLQMATSAVKGLYKIIKYKLKKWNFENVKIENSRTIQETHKKTILLPEPLKNHVNSRTFPEHFQIPEPPCSCTLHSHLPG